MGSLQSRQRRKPNKIKKPTAFAVGFTLSLGENERAVNGQTVGCVRQRKAIERGRRRWRNGITRESEIQIEDLLTAPIQPNVKEGGVALRKGSSHDTGAGGGNEKAKTALTGSNLPLCHLAAVVDSDGIALDIRAYS